MNLQCGSRSDADVALHFNPRYDGQPPYVVVNTMQFGTWGLEERKTSPIPANSTFNLIITVTRDMYQVRSARRAAAPTDRRTAFISPHEPEITGT